MKFGIVANILDFVRPQGAAALARAAEGAGFESLWTVEHPVVPFGYQSEYPYSRSGRMPGGEHTDIPDPLIWLSFVAAHTSRIRLATGILLLPLRAPAITAKEVATLDVLSGGRVTLGVGVGWLAEEFTAVGVPFERRGARLDAYIHALRALWAESEATVHSEFVSLERAVSRPKPARGSVPIVIGGHTQAAARRAGRLGDGFFPARGDLPHLFKVMRRAATKAGRDPDTIELTTFGRDAVGPGALDGVKRLVDLGVDRLVIAPMAFDRDSVADALARYGDDVISKSVS
ncbi:MAG: TIGR03619 family F420-dependent LLM class oxidoreductase [Acidimicrobiales bacterium]